jgi:hypothetical protein
MGIQEALTAYSFQNVGQFRAIAKELGYKEEYNNGDIRFEKGNDVFKISLADIKSHAHENVAATENSLSRLAVFLDKDKLHDPQYTASLLSEKNVSVIHWELNNRSGYNIIDNEHKVCYSAKFMQDYANQEGYLLDGKGTKLERGIMSDMTMVNGQPAKVRLGANGVTIYFKKETLLIPDEILGRKLNNTDKQLLSKGDIVVIPDKKHDIYLQVDKELNSVIVKSSKEISIPSAIGKTEGYPGYQLTNEDKYLLANGHSIDNKLIGTEKGYIIADVSITADKRGVSFANIQSLTDEQAKILIQRQQLQTKEPVTQQRNTVEETQQKAATRQRDMEAEFKDAVGRNDFVKITHLKDEGYTPSSNTLIAMEKDGNLSPNTKVAISKIFGMETGKDKNLLGDIKLAHSLNGEQKHEHSRNPMAGGIARVTDRAFSDL